MIFDFWASLTKVIWDKKWIQRQEQNILSSLLCTMKMCEESIERDINMFFLKRHPWGLSFFWTSVTFLFFLYPSTHSTTYTLQDFPSFLQIVFFHLGLFMMMLIYLLTNFILTLYISFLTSGICGNIRLSTRPKSNHLEVLPSPIILPCALCLHQIPLHLFRGCKINAYRNHNCAILSYRTNFQDNL